jgi:predicted nucleic acid-binding protein
MPGEVFADTGFWFAFLARKDKYHESSVKVMEELMATGTLLSTSEMVVSETYTLLMRKIGTGASLKFIDLLQEQIAQGFTKLYWADWTVMEHAYCILHKYADHQLTYTDATSAALMIKYRIPAIATYDRHFRLMGFTCLSLSI